MKKFSILGLCLFAGLSMSAQMDFVKEVERAVKSTDLNIHEFDYSAVSDKVDAMLENVESKDNAKTWYVAGSAKIADYKSQVAKSSLGQQLDAENMSKSLVDGYGCLYKALSLDSIKDAKGKIKAKESKKIINLMIDNHSCLNQAAGQMIDASKFELANQLLTYYIDMINDVRFEKKVRAQITPQSEAFTYFLRAYSALNIKKNDQCVSDCDKALSLGYNDKMLFDVALGGAFAAQDLKAAYSYAQKAYELYGKEDSNYLKNIINIDVYNKEFDKAKSMLNGLIQAEPNNADCYDLMGNLLVNEGKTEEALDAYRKAVEINDQFALAHYHLGNLLYNKAYAIDNEASSLPQDQYNKIRTEQTEPLLREAASHLEKAYSLDEDNMGDALKDLRNIYYILEDQENLKRVELM